MPRRVAPPRSKHSARSLKSEQSSHEPDSSETKVAQDVTSAAAEEKPEPETPDAVQSPPIAEDPATPQREEEHYEDHEESDLTEQVRSSSYENEMAEEIEYNVDHEERKEEEEEAEFEEEEKATDEENFAEPEKTEEGDEAAGEQASQLYTPQKEEEEIPPPPPPPRRQEGSHSVISSSKATESSSPTLDGKHFFQDTAGELNDS